MSKRGDESDDKRRSPPHFAAMRVACRGPVALDRAAAAAERVLRIGGVGELRVRRERRATRRRRVLRERRRRLLLLLLNGGRRRDRLFVTRPQLAIDWSDCGAELRAAQRAAAAATAAAAGERWRGDGGSGGQRRRLLLLRRDGRC